MALGTGLVRAAASPGGSAGADSGGPAGCGGCRRHRFRENGGRIPAATHPALARWRARGGAICGADEGTHQRPEQPPEPALRATGNSRLSLGEGETAELWQYCVTAEPSAESDCVEGLHADPLQSIAVIRLFLAKWYEPPPAGALHYSTLIQQVLSPIGERCGVTAAEAYRTLCLDGPFHAVGETDFIELLRGLAAPDRLFFDSFAARQLDLAAAHDLASRSV